MGKASWLPLAVLLIALHEAQAFSVDARVLRNSASPRSAVSINPGYVNSGASKQHRTTSVVSMKDEPDLFIPLFVAGSLGGA